MQMYKDYKSPLGYEIGDDGIDSYGVNHNGFSTRDEVEYQMARNQREQQLMQNYNNQGITKNYPQHGTDFWGDNAYNNYGFGTSDISSNIDGVTSQLNNNGFDSTQSNIYENGYNSNQSNEGYNYITDIQKQQCIDTSGMQCTPQNSNNSANMTSMHPDYSQPASLEFDGQYLIWLQNGQPVKYYPAMSGKPDYQSAQYTNERKKGPIPEGDYLLVRGTGEDYSNKEEMSWWRKFVPWNDKPWYEKPSSWGYSRIPIQPLPGTNTFGRRSMYVHGGSEPGSAGCIDLTYRNDDFYNDWLKYNGNLPLKVKYPKGW